MAVFVYIFFLGFCFFRNYKKYGYNAGTYLWSIYFAGSIIAAWLLFGYSAYHIERMRWDAVIFHSICLYLFLSIVVSFANRCSNAELGMPNQFGLKLITYTTIVFGVLAISSAIPKLNTVLSIGEYKDARNLYLRGALHEEGSGGILEYLGSIGGAFSYFALFLFFYYLCYRAKSKAIIISLLIVSLADPLISLTIAGRGGITRWFLVFMFFFFFFRYRIPDAVRKALIKRAVIFATPLILVFIAITFSRFSGRSESIFFSISDYLGQSFIYFSYNFDLFFEPTGYGRKAFPVFFFGSPDSLFEESIYTDYNLNTFSTFVGSFYKDLGFYRTFLLALLLKLWAFFYFRQSKKPTAFPKIIVFIILMQAFVNGYFYYMYSGTTTTRTFIMIYFLSLFIYYRFSVRQRTLNSVGNF